MTARSRHRGHRIEWTGDEWAYTDWDDITLYKYGKERPCTRCDNENTREGPDFCLGKLPQVRQACCGHGHPEDAYFSFHDGTELRGVDAARLRECWIHHRASPSEVIEVYLRVRDVEDVYRLCRLCSTGAVTLPSVISVLDTFRRNSLDIAPFCDILEVYSERNTNRETSMNTKAVTNIQRQADILSDGHQEVVDQAVAATAAIAAMDDRMQKSKEAGNWMGGKVCSSHVSAQFADLKDLLRAQAARVMRACAEIAEIQSTLKID